LLYLDNESVKSEKNTVTGTLIPHQQSNLLLEYDMYFKVKNLYFCKDIRLRAIHTKNIDYIFIKRARYFRESLNLIIIVLA
jgi:hypothetical protein